MENLTAIGRYILSLIQDFPKGAVIVWGLSIIGVMILMWG